MARRAIVLGLLLTIGFLGARQASWYQTSDFYCLYQGARTIAAGKDPYDETVWRDATAGTFPSVYGGTAAPPCPGRYGYPLWTAVALIPIGVMPIELASTAWLTLSIGAAVLGMALAWRAAGGRRRFAALFAVIVVMSQPFWIFLLSGQLSGLLLGLAGATAWAIARTRERTAGVALLLSALKPQVVGITVPAVIVRAALERRWRLVAAAIATGAAMLVVPLAFVRNWPFEWLGEVSGRRIRVVDEMPTAWGFAAQVLGNALWGALVLAVLAAVLVAILWHRQLDTRAVFVLSIPLSLLATPYAWSYDYLVLAVGWAFVLVRAADGGSVRGTALLASVLFVGCVLPWLLYALSFVRGEETLSATIPALTALLVAFALRTAPTSRAASPLG